MLNQYIFHDLPTQIEDYTKSCSTISSCIPFALELNKIICFAECFLQSSVTSRIISSTL